MWSEISFSSMAHFLMSRPQKLCSYTLLGFVCNQRNIPEFLAKRVLHWTLSNVLIKSFFPCHFDIHICVLVHCNSAIGNCPTMVDSFDIISVAD